MNAFSNLFKAAKPSGQFQVPSNSSSDNERSDLPSVAQRPIVAQDMADTTSEVEVEDSAQDDPSGYYEEYAENISVNDDGSVNVVKASIKLTPKKSATTGLRTPQSMLSSQRPQPSSAVLDFTELDTDEESDREPDDDDTFTPVNQITVKINPLKSTGKPLDTDGKPAQSNGTPAQSNGIPAQAKGTSAQSKGTPAQSKGTSALLKGTLAQSNSTLAQLQGTLAQLKGTIAQSQGASAQSKGTPAQSKGTLAYSKGVLAQSNKTPAHAKATSANSKPLTPLQRKLGTLRPSSDSSELDTDDDSELDKEPDHGNPFTQVDRLTVKPMPKKPARKLPEPIKTQPKSQASSRPKDPQTRKDQPATKPARPPVGRPEARPHPGPTSPEIASGSSGTPDTPPIEEALFSKRVTRSQTRCVRYNNRRHFDSTPRRAGLTALEYQGRLVSPAFQDAYGGPSTYGEPIRHVVHRPGPQPSKFKGKGIRKDNLRASKAAQRRKQKKGGVLGAEKEEKVGPMQVIDEEFDSMQVIDEEVDPNEVIDEEDTEEKIDPMQVFDEEKRY
ncbi:hypothetical protein MMC34_004353 [Xylographa carneopallida]|nr:hypothetical protein [Xylographa carneopallida]